MDDDIICRIKSKLSLTAKDRRYSSLSKLISREKEDGEDEEEEEGEEEADA